MVGGGPRAGPRGWRRGATAVDARPLQEEEQEEEQDAAAKTPV